MGFTISGLVRDGDNSWFSNMVLMRVLPTPEGTLTKELAYISGDDVEVLYGFSDLDIVEVEHDSDKAQDIIRHVHADLNIKGVIFLKEGLLVITDLDFFSGFILAPGEEKKAYLSAVEQASFDGDEAAEYMERDARLG